MNKIKVFDYYPQLDAFLCTEQFKQINGKLGLNEWTPVVWLCRLFARDQDFGEHIFDNWDEREALEAQNIDFQFPPNESWSTLLIVNPQRFTEHDAFCIGCKTEIKKAICPNCGNRITVGTDGPCNTDLIKKIFWTDVLKSLEISLDCMFAVARQKHDVETIIKEINLASSINGHS